MKRIFLIGDSIRQGAHDECGYDVLLKQAFAGKAEVVYPQDNCRFALYTLRYLHEWAEQVGDAQEIDCVVWNNGLWDNLHLTGEEQPFVTLPEYLTHMERVYRRIRQVFPNAKVVFVNTTAIDPAKPMPIHSTRDNEEIRCFNCAVEGMLKAFGVPTVDLYSVSLTIPSELRTDWVHYSTEGSKILAKVLIRYLEENVLAE